MESSNYRLLPFRFRKLGEQYLLVSETGQFHQISRIELEELIHFKLNPTGKTFLDLKSKDILCLKYSADLINILAAKYRTKKKHIFDSTALHMMVLTYRCNQRCVYCHAASDFREGKDNLDMSKDTAIKCLEFVFESPSPYLKIEFQGGEPTLNFEVLMTVVLVGNELAQKKNKKVDFVVCTNLYELSDSQIKFLAENNVQISTSLDGPQDIHNQNRITATGKGTYEDFNTNLSRVREDCGQDSVNALLTVTRQNISRLKDVVHEYLNRGFQSVFIRMLNPFGRAYESWSEYGYSIEQFITAYLETLEYIFELNKSGVFFFEEYSTLMLARILTPYPCGFVDLQSPTGAAISCMIYDPNGDIYVSDEARMLNRTNNDKHFCLGNVNTHDRKMVFDTGWLKKMIEESVIESLPGCSWCAYQPYCGSDPVRNYHLNRGYVSHKPTDPYCKLQLSLFDYLFDLLQKDDLEIESAIWSWITGPNIKTPLLQGEACDK